MAALYPRRVRQVPRRAEPLPHDGSLPALDDWRWIHTPGHTRGRLSFFRESDRTLLERPELHGPPAYFTTDWDKARDSVRTLAALQPERLAPGHGAPISGPETRSAPITDATSAVPRPARKVQRSNESDRTRRARSPRHSGDREVRVSGARGSHRKAAVDACDSILPRTACSSGTLNSLSTNERALVRSMQWEVCITGA